jgi:endonuclease IV
VEVVGADEEGSGTLGAHMSGAGGLPRAVERAVIHRCDAFQIFAKNANQTRLLIA